MKDQDPRTKTLDDLARTGRRSTLKAAVAFVAHPDQWMTIEDVAIICGLSPNTIRKHSVRELFNLQVVERKYTYDKDLEPTPMYRLRLIEKTMKGRLNELYWHIYHIQRCTKGQCEVCHDLLEKSMKTVLELQKGEQGGNNNEEDKTITV